jgi:hypothetical protein
MVVDAPKLDKLADGALSLLDEITRCLYSAVVDAACGVDAGPKAPAAEMQDSAAEAMEADSPKVDDGAADSDKPGGGDGTSSDAVFFFALILTLSSSRWSRAQGLHREAVR